MSSERAPTNDVEKRNLKGKGVEESPTLVEEEAAQQLLSLKGGRTITTNESSPKSQKMLEETKLVLQEEKGQFSCKFCNKKFPSYQSLGGHQNAHKNERLYLKMQKELEEKDIMFGPENADLYPYSYYQGAQMMHSMTPQNFGMTSSWSGGIPTSQWRLNLETVWQQMHALAQNAPKSASAGVGLSGLQGSPSAGVGFSGLQGSASAGIGLSGLQGSASSGVGLSGLQGSASAGVGFSGLLGSASAGIGFSGLQGSASAGIGFSGFQGSPNIFKNPVDGSSSGVQGSPSVSNEDPPSEDLDLTLRL